MTKLAEYSIIVTYTNNKGLKMSAMSNLSLEIESMLEQDFRPTTIALMLEIPVDWVYEVLDEIVDNIDEFAV